MWSLTSARSRWAGAALVVAAGLLFSACSGSSDPAGSTAAAPASGTAADEFVSPQADLEAAAPGEDQAGRAAAAAKGSNSAVSPVAPMLAKKASIDLEVRDLASVAAQVRSIAGAQGGFVAGESIGTSGDGGRPASRKSPDGEPFGGYGTMTLSVPSAALEATMTDLAKVGTVLARGSSSADVTSQVVDTDSRVKNMRASVDRVRALMARASDIGEVVALESELSRRQADLDSLESQLKALKGRVEQATVSVSLTTPARAAAVESGGGFTGGLRSGWDAFLSSGRGLLTGVGAVLPFAVFLGLVGAPIIMWMRRRAVRSAPSGAGT